MGLESGEAMEIQRMIRTDKYDYWVWRDTDTREPVCLMRNSGAVPFSACAAQVHRALGKPVPKGCSTVLHLADHARLSIYSEDDFTIDEWNTWLAFGICPAIQVYVKQTSGGIVELIHWGWNRVTG